MVLGVRSALHRRLSEGHMQVTVWGRLETNLRRSNRVRPTAEDGGRSTALNSPLASDEQTLRIAVQMGLGVSSESMAVQVSINVA